MATPTKMTTMQVAATFKQFTNEELLLLNRHLCQLIKHNNTVKRMEATVAFKVGDKVELVHAKVRGTRVCVVNKVKRVNIALVETAGSIEPGKRWNAPATILRKAV